MNPPDHPTHAPDRSSAGDWWQLALAVLVAPFYVGLYVITAIGAAFDRR